MSGRLPPLPPERVARGDARREARIADGTWAVLAPELDAQQLLDLVFTVGAYDLAAMAFRSFDVELDDDLWRKSASP